MLRRDKILRLVVLAVIPLLLVGCFRARALERVAEEIAWQFPEAEFEREFSIALGSFSLGLVKLAASFTEESREARKYLTGIRRVQVAVYKVRHLPSVEDAELPSRLGELLEDDDWDMVVKTAERDERVWILFHEDGNTIRDVHITVLEEDELVLVRVSGRLDELLDKVLEDHGDLTQVIREAKG